MNDKVRYFRNLALILLKIQVVSSIMGYLSYIRRRVTNNH